MRIYLGELRTYIRAVIAETGGGVAIKPQPRGTAPNTSNRTAIGHFGPPPPIELPEHLRDEEITPEECFGPVPPEEEEPGVHADPYVRDASVLPTPQIYR